MKTSGAGPGLAGAILISLVVIGAAEICPAEKPDPNASKSTKEVASIKAVLLKPKSCPDFKDSGEQKHCCPSRITYGTFYCCTEVQLREIEEEISAEKRREFIKQ
uniref:Thyroglobulin type-1 domain-containing protein n=2 Tax=Bursaphelenchus xylophilus TaxID=6326 RepID=A0A1I7SEU0_BURXY